MASYFLNNDIFIDSTPKKLHIQNFHGMNLIRLRTKEWISDFKIELNLFFLGYSLPQCVTNEDQLSNPKLNINALCPAI